MSRDYTKLRVFQLAVDSICSALEARYTTVIKQMGSLMSRVAMTARTRGRLRRGTRPEPPDQAGVRQLLPTEGRAESCKP
jgi:hypothetical protein